MRIGTFLYPWTVTNVGAEATVAELAEAGVSGVDLCAAYHSVTSFSPRAGGSMFFSPRGGVYFPARPSEYSAIVPSVDQAAARAWTDIAAALASAGPGLRLNAWIVAMFQPWLVQDHPEAARVSAIDARSDVAACPANTAVRTLFIELITDICAQFDISEVRLEAIGYLPFTYGLSRPRFLTQLTDVGQWLLSLCCCASCGALAAEHGLDSVGIRQRIRARLAAEMESAGGPCSQAEMLAEDPELQALESLRGQSLVDFVLAMGSAAASAGSTLSISLPAELSGAATPPLSSVINVISSVLLTCPPAVRAEQAASVRSVAAEAGRVVDLRLFAPEWLVTGSGPFDPSDEGGLQQLGRVRSQDVDEVTVYEFGLLRRQEFHAICDAALGR